MATHAERRAARCSRRKIEKMQKLLKEVERKTEILKRLNAFSSRAPENPLNDEILKACKDLITFCTKTRRELCQKTLTE